MESVKWHQTMKANTPKHYQLNKISLEKHPNERIKQFFEGIILRNQNSQNELIKIYFRILKNFLYAFIFV